HEEALALIDSGIPTDQRAMQQRELLALDLAVRLGKSDRAREAAQRLFGMKLDAQSQITLANHMHRLGMTEEAEQVLARAQRTSGGMQALIQLMEQHRAHGKDDQAAAIAVLILRRTRSSTAAPGNSTLARPPGGPPSSPVIATAPASG